MKDIDKQIDDLTQKLNKLKEQKKSMETKELFGNFKEGKYYQLTKGVESIYFKFTKDNVELRDNNIFVRQYISCLISLNKHSYNYRGSINKVDFFNYDIEEIDKSEFDEICEDFKKQIDNIRS